MKPYYEHNGITIYHGDCREVVPTLPAHVLVTDPPYGTGERLRHGGEFSDSRQTWDEWSTEWMEVTDQGAVFCPPRRIPEMAMSVGPTWRLLAWVSPNPVARKNVFPRYGIQPIIAWGATSDGKLDWYKHRSNILTTAHPHQKPIRVMMWLVGLFAGGVIVDPFMGSGTTLVAAKLQNRKAIGIEIEERYCEIAAKRLSQEVFDFTEAPLDTGS